jgi:hypothetical protein
MYSITIHVGVDDPGERARLPHRQPADQPLLGGAEPVGQRTLLDRDPAAERLVDGQPHLAQPADGEGTQQPVAAGHQLSFRRHPVTPDVY